MAKKKRKQKKPETNAELKPLILFALGILLGIIIYTPVPGVGSFIKEIVLGGIMGRLTYALPILLIFISVYIVFKDSKSIRIEKPILFILLFVCIASLITTFDFDIKFTELESENIFVQIATLCGAGTQFAKEANMGGGLAGAILAVPIRKGLGSVFAYAFFGLSILILVVTIACISISSIVEGIKNALANSTEKVKEIASKHRYEEEYEEEDEPEEVEIPVKTRTVSKAKTTNPKFKQIMEQTEIVEPGKQISISDLDLEEYEDDESEEEVEEVEETEDGEDEVEDTIEITEKPEKQKRVLVPIEGKKSSAKEDNKGLRKAVPAEVSNTPVENYDDYIFPPISLLNEGENPNDEYSIKELREVAAKLQKTLSSFNVDAKVVNVTRGPTVTQYEVQPNVGVKVSKILNLADDIALNLAAKSIRIEAPIPGKSAVGIEVPNKVKETVYLRDVIESDAFQEAKSKVSFALGKSIDGEPFISDIAKMPHMLIAGSTGSGKSVCINSILVSLLYKAKPNEVKLILIDPKVVELKVYNDIPHLLIPVVTNAKKAAGALNWAVQEMVNRYNLFAGRGVRDIRGYNELLNQEGEDGLLPQIVIIVDELADLMMVAPSEVEDAICRLAQMARAAGMHLIIATQRPSVDVVTGIIKANIPSRIAFTVSSQVDSRTILDMAGAEKLLGKGDMLYYPIGEEKPIRVQGTYVSDKEIEEIVDFVTKNNPTASFNPDIIETLEKSDRPPQPSDDESTAPDADELLTDAIELAVQMGNASASMIQRKFKVGYARAGRIIDQMEERGIVSGYDGSKPRQTLISKEEWEEMKEAGVDSVRFEEVDEDSDYEEDEDTEEDEDVEYEDEDTEEEYDESEDEEEVEEDGEEEADEDDDSDK